MIAHIITKLKNLHPYLQLQDPVLSLHLWQYLAIFLLFFVSRFAILILLKILLQRFSKRKSFLFVIQRIQKIHSYTLALLLFIQIIPYLNIPSTNTLTSNIVLSINFLCALLLLLLFYRIVDAFFLYFQENLLKNSKRNVYFFPFFRKLSKIIISILSIILLPRFFVIYNISGLLANLSLSIGLVTTAIAFALKDTIHNFIGGMTIVMDNLLRAGDWIIIDGVEGTVVHMDFRTTVIKTDKGSLIHVPNAAFTNKKITNHGHVYKEDFTLQLTIDDLNSSNLDSFLKGFYDMVKQHPEAIEEKCNVRLNTIKGNIFSLSFDLAFRPITERQNILYSCQIVNQLKKLASSISIKLQT